MWNFTLISKVKISREVTMIASKFGIGQQ
ncbi:heat-shock protein HspQ, partial [Escherichia coli]